MFFCLCEPFSCKALARNLYRLRLYLRTCLACKVFTGAKMRRSTGRQPATKSASRPADKLSFDSATVNGVELVAAQDEGFASALCLNSEEVREEVGRVEIRDCGLFGCGLFGFLFVNRERGNVRKLKLVVEGKLRGRVGRVDRARVAQVERDALPLQAHSPASRFFCRARDASTCGCLEPRRGEIYPALPCLKSV